ncbi:hypothetical protein D3C71_1083530 [compost metagenome]
MRRGGPRRPDGSNQPDGKPDHYRPRASAPAHAGCHQHRAHVAEQGLLPGQTGRAKSPSPQVQRHRIQPGTQRQRLAWRPAGYPDDPLGGPSRIRHPEPAGTGGRRLPGRERKRPAGLFPGVPVEGPLCAAHACRSLRRPSAVRPPARHCQTAWVRRRRRQAGRRKLHAAVLPGGDEHCPAERFDHPALRGSHPRAGRRGAAAADQLAIPAARRLHRGA